MSAGRYLASPCCGAAVVGMVDVTVHPRYREDGRSGSLVDSFASIRHAARATAPDPHEAYCNECGEPVDVPHECEQPWRHRGGEA